jgi:two-component system nitrogen regulation response regulator NtrX
VRELRNFIERLLIMCPEQEISEQDINNFLTPQLHPTADDNPSDDFFTGDFKEAKMLFEQKYLLHQLAANNNNISQTAKQIGLDRSYLYHKIKTLGLTI